jgi:hypothetical protein
MISDEKLNEKIEEVTKSYKGDISHLYEAVGMIVIGRLFGWRVMRLASGRRVWADATKLFGDPKELMQEKERYYGKSVGAAIVDKMGNYWEVVKRHQAMPVQDKRIIE